MTGEQKQYREETIEWAKRRAQVPIEDLEALVYELYNAGATRQAKSLQTIMEKLEDWQSK